MKKDNSVYIRHIIKAIERIEEYTKEINQKKFKDSHLIQDAVIRQIQIIGEASKKLSIDITEKYKDIPWRDITGMRDKLVHDYFGVDVEAVWKTVVSDIPELKDKIKNILDERGD
jgi:uncharacterized protein with HEPN domain